MTEEPELELCDICGEERDIFEFEMEDASLIMCITCRRMVQKTSARHQSKVLRYQARRRAIILNSGYEDFTRSEIFNRDNGLCQICGLGVDPFDWHLDHKIPLSKGGDHSRENVGVTHPDCNLRKGARVA